MGPCFVDVTKKLQILADKVQYHRYMYICVSLVTQDDNVDPYRDDLHGIFKIAAICVL